MFAVRIHCMLRAAGKLRCSGGQEIIKKLGEVVEEIGPGIYVTLLDSENSKAAMEIIMSK